MVLEIQKSSFSLQSMQFSHPWSTRLHVFQGALIHLIQYKPHFGPLCKYCAIRTIDVTEHEILQRMLEAKAENLSI